MSPLSRLRSFQAGLAQRRLLAILVALAAVLTAIPVKMVLNSLAGDDVGFVPYYVAVLLAAWLGGLLPGAVATLGAMLVEAILFMEPMGRLEVASPSDRLRLALFGIAALVASWLLWTRIRSEASAVAARDEAARMRERAEVAARRVDALQALATELAGAVTTAQVTDLLLEHGITALRADGAAVFLIEPGAALLEAVAWSGYGPERARRLARVPLDDRLPATEVARTGEAVFIEDPREYLDRYAETIEQYGQPAEPRAVAAVPLEADGRRFGVFGVTWNHRHPLPEDRRAFVRALARLGAAAMDRGRLFDAERSALRRAEAGQLRLDLLAEAGRTLSASLDFEDTLLRLAGLGLPVLGDLGVVDVVGLGERRRLVATSDPDLAGPAAVIEAHPGDPDGSDPVSRVVREGVAGVVELDEAMIEGSARSPEHADALRTLAARWALLVPLRVQDRTIGSLAFLRREDRAHDPDEVALAGELGDRAGRALENARLHGEIARLAVREQLHAAELEKVIASIGEGIVVGSPDGSVRSLNAAAVRLLGGSVTRLDHVLDRLLDADDQRPPRLPAIPTEYRIRSRPTAWVEITAYPVAEPGTVAATPTVVVCRDVTAFRQGQALREAFLGLLSHELRTPVTTIYGGSAVLARPGTSLDATTTQEILSDIAGEADRLYRLVEDLMVLARFDENFELGEEPALLQHLVPAVVQQERARWPGVTFDVEVAPDVPAAAGDETSITQVLRNLLSNAAKYSDGSAVVTAIVEPVADGVAVRVLDEGPGIDPAEAEAIFDPFFRSASTARMAGGAGIGLYVSRRLADAMGGRISAVRRDGGGSEFSFVLRRYRSDAED
jgi:signal transduction histidine kinase